MLQGEGISIKISHFDLATIQYHNAQFPHDIPVNVAPDIEWKCKRGI
jgi:hypothetical protein